MIKLSTRFFYHTSRYTPDEQQRYYEHIQRDIMHSMTLELEKHVLITELPSDIPETSKREISIWVSTREETVNLAAAEARGRHQALTSLMDMFETMAKEQELWKAGSGAGLHWVVSLLEKRLKEQTEDWMGAQR